jgi:hypothetical protein
MGKKKGKKRSLEAGPQQKEPAAAEAAADNSDDAHVGVRQEPAPAATPGAAAAADEPLADEGPPPQWPELDAYLEGAVGGATSKALRQLLVRRGGRDAGPGVDYQRCDPRLAQATSLHTLEICGTALRHLPADGRLLGAMVELQTLRLANNALAGAAALPAALFSAGAGLPKLAVLDLERNALTALPLSLARLPALSVLNASANQLISLPELGCIETLHSLNLTSNRLGCLPATLPPRLATLLLANNQLTALPAAIGDCAALAELDVSANPMRSLPRELAGCARLKTLMVRARPGRLSVLSVPHRKLVFSGGFVWAHGALNLPKRRFPARAVRGVPVRR